MHASDANYNLNYNLNLKTKHNYIGIAPHFGVENSGTYCGRRTLGNRCSMEQVFDVPFSEPPAVLWMGGSIEQRFVLPSLGCCFWWGIEQTFVPFSDMHRPGGIEQTFALPKICSAGNVHRTDVLSNRCSAPLTPRRPAPPIEQVFDTGSKKGSRTFVRLPCHPEWSGAFQEQMYDASQLLPWI